jgi:NADH-quinone oxidoreductase subunit G
VGAVPQAGGLNAGQMLSQPMKALLLLNIEPVLDAADASAARAALAASGLVVALTAFKDAAVDNADVLLPIAPFTETAGTFVNVEGRAQSFHGVVKPRGDARPAWKVLRVLGNLLGLEGFSQESAEAVCAEALGDRAALALRMDNRPSGMPASLAPAAATLQRVADVPIYATDMVVRRAPSLQLTADARPPMASLPSALWRRLGLQPGDKVLVAQGEGAVVLDAREDATLADNAVRVPAGVHATAGLGAMFGGITVEKVVADATARA